MHIARPLLTVRAQSLMLVCLDLFGDKQCPRICLIFNTPNSITLTLTLPLTVNIESHL